MDDSQFYDAVAEELQKQTLVPGVWARAFAEAGGNDAKARALYIKYRVAQMTAASSPEDPPVLSNPAPVAPRATAGSAKRHGCLTTWLIFMLIADALLGLGNAGWALISSLMNSNPELSAKISEAGAAHPTEPIWVTACAGLAYILDIFFVVFIFRWKKWAFFGSVLMSLALFVLLIVGGSSIFGAAGSLLSPIILFGVLQIGGANSGWRRLK
jgi:hypothetical protein